MATTTLAGADWPAWRGPLGSGVSTESGLPERWSATENVAWKARLAGVGVSSPIAAGDQVYVTSQVGAGLRNGKADLELYCLLWALQTRKILEDLERMGERGMLVRYEDLLADPEESLERICTTAHLATTPEALEAMLDYQGQVHGKVRRNPIHRNLQGPVLAQNRRKFAAELSPGQIRRTEVLGRAMLERLGYADAAEDPSLADRVAAAVRIPPRLALNLWRNYRGKSTLTGMELRRRG